MLCASELLDAMAVLVASKDGSLAIDLPHELIAAATGCCGMRTTSKTRGENELREKQLDVMERWTPSGVWRMSLPVSKLK